MSPLLLPATCAAICCTACCASICWYSWYVAIGSGSSRLGERAESTGDTVPPEDESVLPQLDSGWFAV